MKTEPSWRKPAGMLLIILIIIVWAVLVVSLATWISMLPTLVQAVIYIFLGLIWIAPLRPLLIWMETGRWRA